MWSSCVKCSHALPRRMLPALTRENEQPAAVTLLRGRLRKLVTVGQGLEKGDHGILFLAGQPEMA
jgi:hypothetical protein